MKAVYFLNMQLDKANNKGKYNLRINEYGFREDQKKCFKLYYDFFKSIEDRIYLKDVFYISKKEVLKSVLDNDHKRFDKIATCLSLLEEARIQKIEETESDKKNNKKDSK